MASSDELKLVGNQLGSKYEVTCSIIGPEANFMKEVRILNRTIRWTKEGIEYEADDKHAKIVIEECQVKSARTSRIPGVVKKETNCDETPMIPTEALRFRAVAARGN